MLLACIEVQFVGQVAPSHCRQNVQGRHWFIGMHKLEHCQWQASWCCSTMWNG